MRLILENWRYLFMTYWPWCIDCVDSFTVQFAHPLTTGICRYFTAAGAVQWGYQLPLKNDGNSHRSGPLWLRQSQPIFRPTNHKGAMPANWRSCLIPHLYSFCHQPAARTVCSCLTVAASIAFNTRSTARFCGISVAILGDVTGP